MDKKANALQSALPEEHVPFLDHEVEQQIVQPSQRKHWYLPNTMAHILCAISIGFIIASLKYPTEEQCTRKMSTWSPMLEAVEYEWRHLQTTKSSSYYGKPTAQLESKWNGLWQCKCQ